MKCYSFVFCLCLSVVIASGQMLDVRQGLKNHGVCDMSDIRTDISALKVIENCTVIEGNLLVVLMERNVSAEEYRKYANYNLKEITGYLIIYRLKKLESVGDIFPNLALIRGRELFYDHALVVHDMEDLQQIGLYNLLKIERGGVAFQSLPRSCFLNTIDWSTLSNPDDRFFIQSPTNSANCLRREDCTKCKKNTCWDRDHCQQRLEFMSCHKQCLGCDHDNPNLCIRCQKFTYNNTCVDECPDQTVALVNSKTCIKPEECPNFYFKTGWVWNRTCIFKCPSRHKEVKENNEKSCQPCDHCGNVCSSMHVRSLLHLEMMIDCNIIKGYLTIQMKTRHVTMKILEHYLGSIREITDYLVVRDSETITSLSFFKNLKIIRGENVTLNKFSLVVAQLPNLREIFPENYATDMKILNGSISIFGNKLLCSKEIKRFEEELQDAGNKVNITTPEYSIFYACANVSLKMSIVTNNVTSATVIFTPHDYTSSGAPKVNYTVHYVDIDPNDNVRKVDQFCGSYSWKHVAVSAINNIKSSVKVDLNDLTPATTYAVYVDSEPLDNSKHNLTGNSNIIYARSDTEKFITKSDRPPAPHLINLHSFNSSTFFVQWVMHKRYLPLVKRYVLDVVSLYQSYEGFDNRDNCALKRKSDDKDVDRHHRFSDRYKEGDKSECEMFCSEYASEFEESLLNKNDLFDICQEPFDCGDGSDELNEPITEKSKDGRRISFSLELPGRANSYTASNLVHFQEYTLRLKACVGPLESDCGRSARDFVKTRPDEELDKVAVKEAKSKDGFLSLKWDHPKNPNGAVLAYIVRLKENFICSKCGSSLLTSLCISKQKFDEGNQTYTEFLNVEGGDYEYQICTLTLAGETCTKFFKIYIGPAKTVDIGIKNATWLSILLGSLFSVFSISGFFWVSTLNYRNTSEVEDRELLVEHVELEDVSSPVKVKSPDSIKPDSRTPGPSTGVLMESISSSDELSSASTVSTHE